MIVDHWAENTTDHEINVSSAFLPGTMSHLCEGNINGDAGRKIQT